ncbi:hypothetical protein SESBI_46256 [Sesbania bispinosa]|nr:hypothetical protein SESBI_46256 [Sesbania bispinosa]
MFLVLKSYLILRVAVVKAFQAFREEHGILGCHRILNGGGRSLKDRLGDMAGNNMLALAEKRAKREAAKRQPLMQKGRWPLGPFIRSDILPSSNPAQVILRSNTFRCLFFPKDILGYAGSEEDAAMKLLGQQGQRVFTGSSAAEMKRFPGSGGHLMSVAALPRIKKDFEAVSKKAEGRRSREVGCPQEVKGLSDDNIRLTDKNKELRKEIKKLKSDLDTKRS